MTTCPNCGTHVGPLVSLHHVRDEHDRPHTITFHNCLACGFSTWDAAEYEPAPARADITTAPHL